MASDRMNGSVPEKARLQRGYSGKQRGSRSQGELRLDDIAAAEHRRREEQRDTNEREAARALAPVFKAAVALWPGGQEAYAARLGIARPSLVAMCAGERPISPRDWLPLMECPDAWLVWTRDVGRLGGLDVTVRRRAKRTAAEVKDKVVERIRSKKWEGVWERLREEVAEDLDIDPEDVDATLDEDDGADVPREHGAEVRP